MNKMTDLTALNDLRERLLSRAASYRLGGPSSEHSAALYDEAEAAISSLLADMEALKEKLATAGQYTEAHERLDDWHRERVAIAEARATALEERVRGLEAGLKAAEGWFRNYAHQHRMKHSAEGNLKAVTNEDRADYLRALLESKAHV
jgi:hypothetical protein